MARQNVPLQASLVHHTQQRSIGTSAEALLEKARQQALDLGFDPGEVYMPWLPVDAFQQALIGLHGFLGDSALTMVVMALLLRLSTWPLNVRALQRQCDRVELMPVFMDIMKAIELAKRRRGGANQEIAAVVEAAGSQPISESSVAERARAASEAEADIQRLSKQLHDFNESTRFSPLQGMGYQFFCVLPMFLMTLVSLRGMIAHPDAFRSFVVDSPLWLDSLVLADPMGAMPIVSALAVLMNAEINGPPEREGQEENTQYFRLVIRGACLTFVPFTSMLSSGMLVFMATNATYTALATWIFRRYWWTPPRIEPRWIVKAKTIKS